jgi:hypothetical protein
VRVNLDVILAKTPDVSNIPELYALLQKREVRVSRRTLYNWKSGTSGFNPNKLEQVAKVLGLEPKSIITD